MTRINAQRVSEVAIFALYLALLRCLGEYFRLRYARGAELTLAEVAPFITGALMAALGAGAAVVAYFAGRHRLATAVVAGVIAAMLLYKIQVIGP